MKPQRHAHGKNAPSNERQKSEEKKVEKSEQKATQQEIKATREYRAYWFRQWVLTGVIAIGLVFMALRIPGGETIVLSGAGFLTGHSLSTKFIKKQIGKQ